VKDNGVQSDHKVSIRKNIGSIIPNLYGYEFREILDNSQ